MSIKALLTSGEAFKSVSYFTCTDMAHTIRWRAWFSYFQTNFRFLTVLFWNPLNFEALKRFCMEMFQFSEFDHKWITTESSILLFTLLSIPFLTDFALRHHRANAALDSFVLMDSQWLPCQVERKFLITIYALISCVNRSHKIKPVIRLSIYVSLIGVWK